MLADTLGPDVQALVGRKDALAKMRFIYDGPGGTWQMIPPGECAVQQTTGLFGLPLWVTVVGAWVGGLGMGLAIGSYSMARSQR